MPKTLDAILTGTLVICALITTGTVAYRQLRPAQKDSSQSAASKPEFIQSWRSHLVEGVRLGSDSAPVQLIEFADFECPFCRSFHQTLTTLMKRYPNQVSLTFVHFPLMGHRFALPAARAAECAREQGRFEAMHDQLFEGQDSFGLKPWDDYASAAGVPNMEAFNSCIKKTESLPRVDGGRALATKLDVQGTPTVIVNGWKLTRPPSGMDLESMVKLVLAGKSPIAPRT